MRLRWGSANPPPFWIHWSHDVLTEYKVFRWYPATLEWNGNRAPAGGAKFIRLLQGFIQSLAKYRWHLSNRLYYASLAIGCGINLYMGQALRKPHIPMSVFGRKWITKNNLYIFRKLIRKFAKTTERMWTVIPHMLCNFGKLSTSYTEI